MADFKMEYVDAKGKTSNGDNAAFAVNPNDPDKDSFIEGLKNAQDDANVEPRTLEPGNPGALTVDYSHDAPVEGAPGALATAAATTAAATTSDTRKK